MPYYLPDDELIFPHPSLSHKSGLLAVGGDLSVERLLLAYSSGIFPWYSDNSPILWWSPDPRMVLFPSEFKISKSLRITVRKAIFQVRFDHNFESVIRQCATVFREDQDGTWITEEMIKAYCDLHKAGYAHSVESYYNGELVGGLYGVSLGKAFFGESMFHVKTDASKVALYHLVKLLSDWEFLIIDAQQKTRHLISLGGRMISREEFLKIVEQASAFKTMRGNWEHLISL